MEQSIKCSYALCGHTPFMRAVRHNQKKKMKSGERIKLTKGEWFNHYGISIYLLIPILMFGYFAITDQNSNGLIYPAMIFFVVSIFFYWLNWNRLFFQEYKAEMTDEQFERAIKITAKELNWQITKLKGNYVEAFRYPEAFGNGGEKITVKKTEKKVFVNSMGNPELSRKGYSRKRNKENLNSFIINAANILKGKEAEKIVAEKQIKKEEEFWEESEWTIGNILMRFAGYGMTAIFLLIGILFIYEGEWEGIIPIGLALGISLTYVKNDIQIIREKNRRKKLKKKKAVPNNG